MRLLDLALECSRVIESGTMTKVCLVVPGPPPRGRRVRIDRGSGNRRRCPMGEVANWQDNPPRTVAYFDALEVLAWLAAIGAIEVSEATAAAMGGPHGCTP